MSLELLSQLLFSLSCLSQNGHGPSMASSGFSLTGSIQYLFQNSNSPAYRPAGDYTPYERSLLKIPNNVATSVQRFCGARKNFLVENCSRQRS